MKMRKFYSVFFSIMALVFLSIPDVRAGIKLQGILVTAYQECEDLGNDVLAIQSIRNELKSSKQVILRDTWKFW